MGFCAARGHRDPGGRTRCPLVAEFSVAEFAAAVGLGTETGKRYVGQAVELRYRLRAVGPGHCGDLAAWKARRVADDTMRLTVEAAEYVDSSRPGRPQGQPRPGLDRLVTEAVGAVHARGGRRGPPPAWDQRHATVDYGTVGIAGTCQVTGEARPGRRPRPRRGPGRRRPGTRPTSAPPSTLDQRRAAALGDFARRDLALDYPQRRQPDQPSTTVPRSRSRRGRSVLHPTLHLRHPRPPPPAATTIGRVENTRPVTAETIRAWCGNPDARSSSNRSSTSPRHDVEAYEVPDRIAEALACAT